MDQNQNEEQHTYTEKWMDNQKSTTDVISHLFGDSSISRDTSSVVMHNPYDPVIPVNDNSDRQKNIGFAITGMVCGIFSMLACILMLFDIIVSILGLIFSIIAIAKKYAGKGMAIAGIVCSCVGLVLSVGFFILCIAFSI